MTQGCPGGGGGGGGPRGGLAGGSARRRRGLPPASGLPDHRVPELLESSRCLCHPLYRITSVPHQHLAKITTKDLKEKEVVEEAESGREAPPTGMLMRKMGEQEADNQVDEEEEEGGEEEEEEEEGDGDEEEEEAGAATGKRAAEDDEDDDVDTEKQKTDEDD
ncbi:prothymosin alpha-like [Echinops telfairi]|uniref:Prothymosin alpha-like n=1 Tax=Echinops telfairi TaxID=9371 RepID=A0AC55D3A9_ECHTE|nr:prothymosin alpha-like [Echinops telfairi]